MITVIIPLYNKEKHIADTVNSVLRQTFSDFELLIINDGSTDRSLQVVQELSDGRIVLINKDNTGVADTRNVGIKRARYNWLAFLDADDLWTDNHLETLVALKEKYAAQGPGGFVTSFVKSHIAEIPHIDQKHGDYLYRDYFSPASEPVEMMSSSNFMIRKDLCMQENIFYNPQFSYGEDVEFWYRYFHKHAIVKSSTITAVYFVGAENRSNKKIIPLDKRFSQFDFRGKSESEKKYLGKLVALLLIDYTARGEYSIAFKVFIKYFSNLRYATYYVWLLIRKKLKNA